MQSRHTSAALSKWLKKDFDSLTAHCLRHICRDRMRAVDCAIYTINIGSCKSVRSIGNSYGNGYELSKIRENIEAMSVKN